MRSLRALLAGLAATYALPTIESYGNKFYDSNDNQFFIKGEHRLPTSRQHIDVLHALTH